MPYCFSLEKFPFRLLKNVVDWIMRNPKFIIVLSSLNQFVFCILADAVYLIIELFIIFAVLVFLLHTKYTVFRIKAENTLIEKVMLY